MSKGRVAGAAAVWLQEQRVRTYVQLATTICWVSGRPCNASLSTGYTQGFTCKLAHLGWRFSWSWRRCGLLGLRRWGRCREQPTEYKSALGALQSAGCRTMQWCTARNASPKPKQDIVLAPGMTSHGTQGTSLRHGITCKQASQQQDCATHQGQAPWAGVGLSSQALGPAGSQVVNVALDHMRLGVAERHKNVAWRMTESPTEDRQVKQCTGCCACVQQGRWTSSCTSAHLL